MKALIVEAYREPYLKELPDLEAMQMCVGGHIEAVYPWKGIPVALVCDEEGLFHSADWNRYISDGVAIRGTFFICGIGDEDFEDIPDEYIGYFTRKFSDPNTFVCPDESLLREDTLPDIVIW